MIRIRPQISRNNRQPNTGSAPGVGRYIATNAPQEPGGDPISTLNALEQWRVQDETHQQQSVSWPLEKFPLKVAIEPHPDGDASGLTPKGIFAVLRQWEAAYPGVIRFQLADTPAQCKSADILIRWSRQTTLGRDYEVGHTNRAVRGKRITGAEITLIVSPVIDRHIGPAQQQQRLFATILHEMGHALGLEHSESREDVMYYRGWQRGYLSNGDIQRMKTLYSTGQCFNG